MWMQKSFFIIIIVVGCLLTMGYNDFTFMVGFITFILSLFTVSSISYDEFDNGYPFLLTLPFSRKTYVIEKYVFGLILGLTGWLVSVLISYIMIIMNGEKITLDIMIGGLVIFTNVSLYSIIDDSHSSAFWWRKRKICVDCQFWNYLCDWFWYYQSDRTVTS